MCHSRKDMPWIKFLAVACIVIVRCHAASYHLLQDETEEYKQIDQREQNRDLYDERKYFGKYFLPTGKKLGQGAFGIVRQYKVTKTINIGSKTLKKDEMVAVKTLLFSKKNNARIIEREIASAKMLMKRDHPNICKVFDVYVFETRISIVMELLRGQEVAKVLEEQERFPLQVAAYITYQLCQAIRFLHKEGIMHRDIKPDNMVFVEPFSDNGDCPEVKVVDFGFSIQAEKTELNAGTLTYMSPETKLSRQGLAGAEQTNKIDCWSVGVTFLELLYGSEACREFTHYGCIFTKTRFVKRYGADHALACGILEKLLAHNPEKRLDMEGMFHRLIVAGYKRLPKERKFYKWNNARKRWEMRYYAMDFINFELKYFKDSKLKNKSGKQNVIVSAITNVRAGVREGKVALRLEQTVNGETHIRYLAPFEDDKFDDCRLFKDLAYALHHYYNSLCNEYTKEHWVVKEKAAKEKAAKENRVDDLIAAAINVNAGTDPLGASTSLPEKRKEKFVLAKEHEKKLTTVVKLIHTFHKQMDRMRRALKKSHVWKPWPVAFDVRTL